MPDSVATDADQLLDLGGVAALLNISGRHVLNLVACGVMPAPLRLGRCVRWRRSDILRVIRRLAHDDE